MEAGLKLANSLVEYGRHKQLIQQEDAIFVRNRIFAILKIESPIISNAHYHYSSIEHLFRQYYAEAMDTKVWTQLEKDAFQDEVLNLFTKYPSEVDTIFAQNLLESPKIATEHFYAYCQAVNYIKDSSQNKMWVLPTAYGDCEITINLSKPEKDPRDIAKVLENPVPVHAYPKCQLCIENVGYAGHLGHPNRANLRIIPCTLQNEQWYFQFSPYSYYTEHAIVLKQTHEEMKLNFKTFKRLFDFIDLFPHYFVGSNADLPIVGGSILNHDHFQAGKYEFPLMKACTIQQREQGSVVFDILNWPISVIRLTSKSRISLENSAISLFDYWKNYNNEQLNIIAKTTTPHNTITPIVRKKDDEYEVYIALRNNRTTAEFPYGIFHPHEEIHHIKKENIGLIEVMGLAILPPRILAYFDINSSEARTRITGYGSGVIDTKGIETYIGNCFMQGLEHAGVFKKKEDLVDFLDDFLEAHPQ